MGSATPTSKLFEPLQVGSMKLSSRCIMAPLTRFRAEDNHVLMPMGQDYYGQRAEAVPGTLLITEGTAINPHAVGYPNIPGIWNQEQVNAWRIVTDRVHKAGSYIYLQLWATGRTAMADVLKKEVGPDVDVVSSSAVPYADNATVPRALTEEEIQDFIQAYAAAAHRAVHEAGFDGVEIHGANGYLIDQFTQDICNQRTDAWGGSVEKRNRFALEVTRAVARAVGPERTGIRLSPWSVFQGMKMRDPVPQFSHLVEELKKEGLAYLHLVESRINGNADIEATEKNDPFIKIWGRAAPILLAGGFKAKSAKTAVDEEYRDLDAAIVFGRYFISTPDLIYRLQRGIELTPYNRDLFYSAKDPKGYIDWEFSEQWKKEHAGR